MPRVQEIRLPNGKDVYCICPTTAHFIYREVFVEPSYFQHGISLKEGDRVFDVGSNMGFFLLLLNDIASNLEVFSFEPIPSTFAVLEKNAARHVRQKLNLFNCGLSNRRGDAVFQSFPRTPAISSMVHKFQDIPAEQRIQSIMQDMAELPNRPLRWGLGLLPTPIRRGLAGWLHRYYGKSEEVTCALRTLSDVIDEYGLDRLDLVKIDTEGAEHDILEGIRPEHWPLIRQLVVEVHDGEDGCRRIKQRFDDLGFTTVAERHEKFTDLSLVFARRV